MLELVLLGLLALVVAVSAAVFVFFWYMGRHGGTTIRDAGLAGRFYAAPGAARRTAVLMLGGSNGSYPYDGAAQSLADAGYPVFALAYFKGYARNPQGVPDHLSEIPLEYFFRAIEWMKARPEVDADKIVLMGESRGGELVLLLAAHRPEVAGVIAFSPSHVVWSGLKPPDFDGPSWVQDGKPLPYLEASTFRPEKGIDGFVKALDEASPDALCAAAIAVENIGGPVLLISSKADLMWPSCRMADEAEKRLKAHGFTHPVQNIQYEDASHLLMGPGRAMTALRIPFVFTVNFGGTKRGTEMARNAGWAEAKAFLARIGQDTSYSSLS